ncbi:MAG: hypothetical protein WAS54_04890 [Scrofimicrobium sp.]
MSWNWGGEDESFTVAIWLIDVNLTDDGLIKTRAGEVVPSVETPGLVAVGYGYCPNMRT